MSDSTNGDYGEFAPGIGKVVGTFEFRRRRDTDEIAVYDPEAASPKPLGFAPSTIKTVGEAELWANGLRIGLDHGLKTGRKHLQDELRELLNVK